MHVILIIFQIYCVVMISWCHALENSNGAWQSLGALPYLGLCVLSVVVGIILTIIYILKGRNTEAASVFISWVAAALIAFTGLKEPLVYALEPLAARSLNKKYQDKSKDYLVKKQADYFALKEYFSQPRKVIKAKGVHILFEDYKIVSILRGVPGQVNNPDFDLFLQEKVVGHFVNVDIGSWDQFSRDYVPNSISDFATDLRGRMSLREQAMLSFYSTIPADVYLDGVSLGDKLIRMEMVKP